METSVIIAIGISVLSLALSIIMGIYTLRTKRYELVSIQRKEVLAWFGAVTELLVALQHEIREGKDLSAKLIKLSALIDQGRIYFPNVLGDKDHGKEKPLAFRGHRDVALDLLVLYFDVAKRPDAQKQAEHLIHVHRLFVSRVFEVLRPREFNKLTRRFTPLSFDKNSFSLEEVLKTEPKELNALYAEAKKGGRA